MSSTRALYLPVAQCRRLGVTLSLLIASGPNYAAAGETPEILVESEAGALPAGWLISSDTASLLSGETGKLSTSAARPTTIILPRCARFS